MDRTALSLMTLLLGSVSLSALAQPVTRQEFDALEARVDVLLDGVGCCAFMVVPGPLEQSDRLAREVEVVAKTLAVAATDARIILQALQGLLDELYHTDWSCTASNGFHQLFTEVAEL